MTHKSQPGPERPDDPLPNPSPSPAGALPMSEQYEPRVAGPAVPGGRACPCRRRRLAGLSRVLVFVGGLILLVDAPASFLLAAGVRRAGGRLRDGLAASCACPTCVAGAAARPSTSNFPDASSRSWKLRYPRDFTVRETAEILNIAEGAVSPNAPTDEDPCRTWRNPGGGGV